MKKKIININEPFESFENNKCDKDDLVRSINSFKQMYNKINQLYSDAEISTDNTQIDLLTDSIKNADSDEDVFKVSDSLWDFLKMTYMVNIDYIKTNFYNMKQIESELNTFKTKEKNTLDTIDQLKRDQDLKEDLYKKEMEKYNHLVKKTDILKLFFYVITGLLIVPLLYSFNVLSRNVSFVILVVSILAAMGYVIYKFVKD